MARHTILIGVRSKICQGVSECLSSDRRCEGAWCLLRLGSNGWMEEQ